MYAAQWEVKRDYYLLHSGHYPLYPFIGSLIRLLLILTSVPRILNSFITYVFIQHIFIGLLVCARHCSRHWRCKSKLYCPYPHGVNLASGGGDRHWTSITLMEVDSFHTSEEMAPEPLMLTMRLSAIILHPSTGSKTEELSSSLPMETHSLYHSLSLSSLTSVSTKNSGLSGDPTNPNPNIHKAVTPAPTSSPTPPTLLLYPEECSVHHHYPTSSKCPWMLLSPEGSN